MKLVIVSPHRDDAAFSLSLAIQWWLDAGHTVAVLNCFTRSEYAPFCDAASIHPNDRVSYVTALRLREDVKWRGNFGPKLTLSEINLKDAPLRLHCRAEDVCGISPRLNDKSTAKIERAVERAKAQALILPLALGAHVDHLTARLAAMPLHFDAIPCAFYEDLPYAARPGIADEIEAVAHGLHSELAPVFAGQQTEDDSPVLFKRRMALCYDSQIDEECTEQVARFCMRYQGRERLWGNPAWRACPALKEFPVAAFC